MTRHRSSSLISDRLSGRLPWFASFTLIELLVVTAILAVLAALIFPALQGAKDTAKAAQCMGNLRQWALAITIFSENNDGRYPMPMYASGNLGWKDEVQPYIMPGEMLPYGGLYSLGFYPNDPLVNRYKGVLCPEGPRIADLRESGGVMGANPAYWYIPYNGETHYHGIFDTSYPGLRALYNGGYLINYYACYWGWVISGQLSTNTDVNALAPYCFQQGRHKFPAQTALLLEGAWGGNRGFYFNGNTLTNLSQLAHIEWRHRRGRLINVLFYDGHATAMTQLPVAPSGANKEASMFWRGSSDGGYLNYTSND
jgi:prepilin-type N-terminal cleavage/methylation domain-containing protein/prepilin-type processing-associated H-X9-DG protein